MREIGGEQESASPFPNQVTNAVSDSFPIVSRAFSKPNHKVHRTRTSQNFFPLFPYFSPSFHEVGGEIVSTRSSPSKHPFKARISLVPQLRSASLLLSQYPRLLRGIFLSSSLAESSVKNEKRVWTYPLAPCSYGCALENNARTTMRKPPNTKY